MPSKLRRGKIGWRKGERFDPVARTRWHLVQGAHYNNTEFWLGYYSPLNLTLIQCSSSLLFILPEAEDKSNDGLGRVIRIPKVHKITFEKGKRSECVSMTRHFTR